MFALSLPQVFVERVKALETFAENFFIAQTAPRPALENFVETNALGTLELSIFEVRIVNHLGDLLNRFVADIEATDKRFKGAVLAVMCELHVQHVVGNRARRE